MKKIEEEEQSIPMRVALSYKNVAKEYKKEKKIWQYVVIAFIIISLALSTYIIVLLDSLNDDIGLIRDEVEDIIEQE